MPPRKRKAPSSEKKPPIIPKEEEETSEEEEEEESSSEEKEVESSEEEEDDNESSSEDESNEEESKRENLRKLLEPFGKDQIVNFLKDAAAKDPKLLAKIVEMADSDPAHRNIFVHGLGYDATPEQLLQTFNQFGEIEEHKLITDKATGRAKGYAFVRFKTRAAATKALKVPQKQIGSRLVSCQLAAAGPPGGAAVTSEGGSRKVYVGNVGPHVSVEKLKAFFARYGELEDAPIGLDFATNKFRGFAVLTYKSPDGFKKALEEPIKVFENSQLHCKKFVEKEKQSSNNNNVAGQISGGGVNPAINNFGANMNPGIFGANMNASGIMIPQNFGIGLAGNPMLAAGYNQAALMASGLSGNYGISNNSIGSGVIGSFGSQAALQGLGPYQNSQTGQSSLGTATKRDSANGQSPARTFPSYFGR